MNRASEWVRLSLHVMRGSPTVPLALPTLFAARHTGHSLEGPAMGRSRGRDRANACCAEAASRVDWCLLALGRTSLRAAASNGSRREFEEFLRSGSFCL